MKLSEVLVLKHKNISKIQEIAQKWRGGREAIYRLSVAIGYLA